MHTSLSARITSEHARRLTQAARLLAEARTPTALAAAVQANLQTWEALKRATDHGALPVSERHRINRLARHVLDTTRRYSGLGGRVAPADAALEGFISMNRQLARDLERDTAAAKGGEPFHPAAPVPTRRRLTRMPANSTS